MCRGGDSSTLVTQSEIARYGDGASAYVSGAHSDVPTAVGERNGYRINVGLHPPMSDCVGAGGMRKIIAYPHFVEHTKRQICRRLPRERFGQRRGQLLGDPPRKAF